MLKQSKDKRFSIQLSRETYDLIKETAEVMNLSMSALCSYILENSHYSFEMLRDAVSIAKDDSLAAMDFLQKASEFISEDAFLKSQKIGFEKDLKIRRKKPSKKSQKNEV